MSVLRAIGIVLEFDIVIHDYMQQHRLDLVGGEKATRAYKQRRSIGKSLSSDKDDSPCMSSMSKNEIFRRGAHVLVFHALGVGDLLTFFRIPPRIEGLCVGIVLFVVCNRQERCANKGVSWDRHTI